MWPQVLFGAFLIVVAGTLAWHSHTLSLQDDRTTMPAAELRLHRRRSWLRAVGSGLIGLIGLAMVTGTLIRDPRRMLFFWGGILCLVLALVAVASLDLLGTGQHLRFLRRRQRESQDKLRVEIAAELARRKQSTDGST